MGVRTTLGIVSLTLAMGMPGYAAERTFSADWSTANWHVVASPMACRLQQPIANFGMAEFQHVHAQKVQFILHRDASLLSAGFAAIERLAPAWRDKKQGVLLGKARLHLGKEILTTDTPLAVAMLSALEGGQLTRIQYQGDAHEQVRIELSPLNFQTTYAHFVKCQGQLLAFDKQSVENTNIYFENNTSDLTARGLAQLNRIAEYVAADKEVRRISIAGYSDGSGRTGYDNWLSELRAKAVQDYLKLKGIPGEKIKITWYGKKHAQTDSTTEVGRALNRRVNVKLYGF